MNIQEKDILNALCDEQFISQRILSDMTGHSLGTINKSINELVDNRYLDKDIKLTNKSKELIKKCKPQNAIILAAGFGMRMVPINMDTTKGLLVIHGEPLIERIINQLHEQGITDISIVVGYMKEKYEYLIDKYNVELVVNDKYAAKNNLYSMRLVADKLSNTYIIPCDIWCDNNPFSSHELYSWYMVSDMVDDESTVRVNRKMELTTIQATSSGNAMIGICYLLKDDAMIIKNRIMDMSSKTQYDSDFWEIALYNKHSMMISAKVVHASDVVEINTYDQLRDLDSNSNNLKSDAISIIADVFKVNNSQIKDISVLKKGMTNRSFLFKCKNKKYIMRIPGEGTNNLISRSDEVDTYKAIQGKKICDNIIYLNPDNGYKITEFINDVRNCNPKNSEEVRKCMVYLRHFHDMDIKVGHTFNIYEKIEFYQSLWGGNPSIYRDYEKTKENVLKLKPYIESHIQKTVLTHIDAVCDNFLFVRDIDGNEAIRLIDWEYAGMQDPHVDIAMFAIYAMYDREEVEKLIDYYFPEGCTTENRIKIYCYVATCGLLWSNWCEYKRNLGVEFGEYSLKQYRYAKEYFRIAEKEFDSKGITL